MLLCVGILFFVIINIIININVLIIDISHLVYLYYRASRGLTKIFSLPEGYKGKYHNSLLLAMNDATIMLLSLGYQPLHTGRKSLVTSLYPRCSSGI